MDAEDEDELLITYVKAEAKAAADKVAEKVNSRIDLLHAHGLKLDRLQLAEIVREGFAGQVEALVGDALGRDADLRAKAEAKAGGEAALAEAMAARGEILATGRKAFRRFIAAKLVEATADKYGTADARPEALARGAMGMATARELMPRANRFELVQAMYAGRDDLPADMQAAIGLAALVFDDDLSAEEAAYIDAELGVDEMVDDLLAQAEGRPQDAPQALQDDYAPPNVVTLIADEDIGEMTVRVKPMAPPPQEAQRPVNVGPQGNSVKPTKVPKGFSGAHDARNWTQTNSIMETPPPLTTWYAPGQAPDNAVNPHEIPTTTRER
jgi:hypothetical protein